MSKRLRQPQTSKLAHPMQPVGFDKHGVARFKGNEIVKHLMNLLHGKFDLNDLAIAMNDGLFTKEDYTQLMQLIGYSVGGAGDLSQFSRRVTRQADAEVERIVARDPAQRT